VDNIDYVVYNIHALIESGDP